MYKILQYQNRIQIPYKQYCVFSTVDYVELYGHGCCIGPTTFHQRCLNDTGVSIGDCQTYCTLDKQCKGFYYGLNENPGMCRLATTSNVCPHVFKMNDPDLGNIGPIVSANCSTAGVSACVVKVQRKWVVNTSFEEYIEQCGNNAIQDMISIWPHIMLLLGSSSGSSYVLVRSGSTCTRITSLSECSTAARALGLLDTTASYDEHTGSGVSYDPPYCYFEGGTLKYNSNGRNTGGCTTSDSCVCRKGTYFA